MKGQTRGGLAKRLGPEAQNGKKCHFSHWKMPFIISKGGGFAQKNHIFTNTNRSVKYGAEDQKSIGLEKYHQRYKRLFLRKLDFSEISRFLRKMTFRWKLLLPALCPFFEALFFHIFQNVKKKGRARFTLFEKTRFFDEKKVLQKIIKKYLSVNSVLCILGERAFSLAVFFLIPFVFLCCVF